MEKNKGTSPKVDVIMPFEKQGEYYIENLGTLTDKQAYAVLKRVLDIFLSVVALLILAIPMLLISIMIKITTKGNVLYYQERLGLNGKKFIVIKFRTMCVDAESQGVQWSNGDNDPRITPIGRLLRKTRLDELPQLWCILKGDMSIVGPRPERGVYYIEFEKYIHGFSERLKVKPGLTGWAQINGGYNLKPEEKILYDIEYIKKRSIWFDLRIVLGTIRVLFSHDGAK